MADVYRGETKVINSVSTKLRECKKHGELGDLFLSLTRSLRRGDFRDTFDFLVPKGTRPPETTSGIAGSRRSTWLTGPRGRDGTVKHAAGKKPNHDQSGCVCSLPGSLQLRISWSASV